MSVRLSIPLLSSPSLPLPSTLSHPPSPFLPLPCFPSFGSKKIYLEPYYYIIVVACDPSPSPFLLLPPSPPFSPPLLPSLLPSPPPFPPPLLSSLPSSFPFSPPLLPPLSQISSLLAVVWLFGLYLTVFSYQLHIPSYSGVIAIFILVLILFALPLPFLYYRSRIWLAKELVRVR